MLSEPPGKPFEQSYNVCLKTIGIMSPREMYTHAVGSSSLGTRSHRPPHTVWAPDQQQVGRHSLVTNLQLLGSSVGPIFSEALEIHVSNSEERGNLEADIELGQAAALPCSSCLSEVVQLRMHGKWASASFVPTFHSNSS